MSFVKLLKMKNMIVLHVLVIFDRLTRKPERKFVTHFFLVSNNAKNIGNHIYFTRYLASFFET